jgi:hypothetical protein
MSVSDEELLHRFYAGESAAIDELAQRLDPFLTRVGEQVFLVRAGSAIQAQEWDVGERLHAVWILVMMSRKVNMGSWPSQRLSALTWLIHLLCQEIDRHLGMQPPF